MLIVFLDVPFIKSSRLALGSGAEVKAHVQAQLEEVAERQLLKRDIE